MWRSFIVFIIIIYAIIGVKNEMNMARIKRDPKKVALA